MSSAHKVIIDTDPGVDDAMAILYAMLKPEIDLVGLTSIFGNVFTDTATRNALALTELAEHPLSRRSRGAKAARAGTTGTCLFVHGREGFGDVPPFVPKTAPEPVSAAQFICNMINRYPGEIVLCPIGPLTNVALALEHDPTIVEKVKSVTVMGASLEEGGNVTPFAEANIWQDPHAAKQVFGAAWDVTIVGLDVTHQIICTPDDFASLVEPAPVLGGFLNEAAQFYFDFTASPTAWKGVTCTTLLRSYRSSSRNCLRLTESR